MSIKKVPNRPLQGQVRNCKLKKIAVILGPTASGKSKWAEKLCCQFNGEIISADSRQIYREMDIGTAKVKSEKLKVKSYLIDIINPDQNFTVSQYKKLADRAIKDIQKRGKIPFLVGGTGLYIQAVVDNLKIPRVKADLKLRQRLFRKTHQQLLAQLKKLDPQAAKKIDAKNKRRLIRALEVCLTTGKPFSKQQQKGKPLYDVLQIGIKVPREVLYQQINRRVGQMIKQGLVKEVKGLLKKYCLKVGTGPRVAARGRRELSLPAELPPALSGIGYQEIIQYLAGKISLAEAVKLIKQHSRQYSRRQMTWFRRDSRIHWIAEYEKAQKLVKEFLEKEKGVSLTETP